LAHLPAQPSSLIINLGIAAKTENCEAVSADHWWYNIDDEHSGCYNCEMIKPGRLWQSRN